MPKWRAPTTNVIPNTPTLRSLILGAILMRKLRQLTMISIGKVIALELLSVRSPRLPR
jgi:hypothetical protein